jgi:hypothetical protein
MSGVNVSSGVSSAPTSTASRPNTASTDSARQFLDHEAERAKAAMLEALHRAKQSLGESVDPRQITKKHPFLTVTSAVVAGFAAAVVTIPSKEEQELRRLEKIRRAMNPEPTPKPAETNGTSKESAKGPANGPWWLSIMHEVIQLARPLLTAAITAQMTKKTPPVDDAVDRGPIPPNTSM